MNATCRSRCSPHHSQNDVTLPLPVTRAQRLGASAHAAAQGGSSTHLGTGWVVYDPGGPADRFLERGGNYPLANFFGNVFDTSRGDPLHSGTITQIAWYQGTAEGQIKVVFGPTGTSFYTGTVGASPAPFQLNFVDVSAKVTGPMWVGVSAHLGQVGARAATRDGQGFHGAVRGRCYPASACPPVGYQLRRQIGFYPYSVRFDSLNVMVYIGGSVVIPVELLEFEAE